VIAGHDVIAAPPPATVIVAKEALARLRLVFSNSELAEQIPVEAYRMGFTRILFSRIRHKTWFTQSAYIADDDHLATMLLEAGLAHPRRLTAPLLESEMVRRGVPILVDNPQSNPRVNRELVALTNTRTYVAAPVYAWRMPVGLLHADAPTEVGNVDVAERDLLGLFAEGVGVILERNLILERLQAMRDATMEHTRGVRSLAEDFDVEMWENPDVDVHADPSRATGWHTAPAPAPMGDLTAELSRREREVLHCLATGKTNAQIADRLFITEGTVKSHVKHIMQKLCATNRTHAVANYQRWAALQQH